MSALAQARSRMQRLNLWHPGQQMGRRWAMGCVALEVTQRCNLDCTLCYLSESSEALSDVPLEELFRRLQDIRERYGPNTDVQITGGEPTLRPLPDLVALVRRAHSLGLRPALFTNGIRAKRPLLAALCQAGLVDVAFHVDLTQQRKSYSSELALNALRKTYIDRARGLPLAVYFNTTVFDGNLDQIADVARFFVQHADAVRLASFQLQAETGRGVLGRRGSALDTEAVMARIRAGAGAPLRFDAFDIGHPRCNRYAMTLVASGRVHDLLDQPEFARRLLCETADLAVDRTTPARSLLVIAIRLLARPRLLPAALAWLARRLWRMKADLRPGRVHKLSFFVHNFMDACSLESERIEACSFMVAAADGPVSMCLHNAARDEHLLKPLALGGTSVVRWWNPVGGRLHDAPPLVRAPRLTYKNARGRAKAALQR